MTNKPILKAADWTEETKIYKRQQLCIKFCAGIGDKKLKEIGSLDKVFSEWEKAIESFQIELGKRIWWDFDFKDKNTWPEKDGWYYVHGPNVYTADFNGGRWETYDSYFGDDHTEDVTHYMKITPPGGDDG